MDINEPLLPSLPCDNDALKASLISVYGPGGREAIQSLALARVEWRINVDQVNRVVREGAQQSRLSPSTTRPGTVAQDVADGSRTQLHRILICLVLDDVPVALSPNCGALLHVPRSRRRRRADNTVTRCDERDLQLGTAPDLALVQLVAEAGARGHLVVAVLRLYQSR